MKPIKIFDRMGDYVASFVDPQTAGSALGTCFTGCWVLKEEDDPEDGISEETIAEIEKHCLKARTSLFETEFYKDIPLVSVEIPSTGYKHIAYSDNDGIHIILGRSYGLVSPWEEVFTAMIGQKFHLVMATKNYMTLVWKEGDNYREYTVFNKTDSPVEVTF